ncbi:MAG: RNA polymerase sigma factor [Planctomycetota bacterium]
MGLTEDKVLVRNCKRGSREALCRIYEKYKDDLMVLAIALLNDSSAAEDIVHDVFISFVQVVEKFRLTGSLKGYLATCVANRARNINRSKQAQVVKLSGADPVSEESSQPYRAIACNEELQQLSRAMTQLPYLQREVVMLHLRAGMKFRAIAKSQGISVNTAKSRYRYGLDKLRSILNGEVDK